MPRAFTRFGTRVVVPAPRARCVGASDSALDDPATLGVGFAPGEGGGRLFRFVGLVVALGFGLVGQARATDWAQRRVLFGTYRR